MLGQRHIPMVTKKSPEKPKSALYKQFNTNTKLSILPTMLQQNDNDENNKRKEKILDRQYVAVTTNASC